WHSSQSLLRGLSESLYIGHIRAAVNRQPRDRHGPEKVFSFLLRPSNPCPAAIRQYPYNKEEPQRDGITHPVVSVMLPFLNSGAFPCYAVLPVLEL
ncbi:MAG: hypothetical protein SPC96_01720, partial [Desulfovibrio sp.]|nr:hypothetical protein [Desulfovibrio sp.]